MSLNIGNSKIGNIKQKVLSVIEEMKPYIDVDKDKFLIIMIRKRLNKSLSEYKRSLDVSYERLAEYYDSKGLNLMKRMVKKDDRCDK